YPSFYLLFFHSYLYNHHLHSFPTRRSSDLVDDEEIERRHEDACEDDEQRRPLHGLLDRPLLNHHRDGRWRSPCSGRRCSSSSQRSEEHTSELQSQSNLVCRLLLEKKKKKKK